MREGWSGWEFTPMYIGESRMPRHPTALAGTPKIYLPKDAALINLWKRVKTNWYYTATGALIPG